MNLSSILKQERESQAEYFARTIWGTGQFPNFTVFEFNNEQDKMDPNVKPAKIISITEARKYLDTLELEQETETETQEILEPKKVESEMIKIELEPLDCGPQGTIWMDSITGEVIHKLGDWK